tara:strand:+ start:343 stop:1329 length:987 start_codon:yes stop_codon:yes gene_type:complete
MNYKSYLVEQNINILRNKILLFYGENLGLKNDFKKKLKLINSNAVVARFTQEEVLKNQNYFIENLLNISLFNEEKIYFIEQVNDKILELIENLKDKIDDQKIYLFSEILDKKSKLRSEFEKSKELGVVACYNDNEINIKKIILERLRGYEGLSLASINLIIENSNLDRAKLNNELDKIETFFLNRKIVNSELIKLLNINENDNFNMLKDAVLAGNSKKTNKLLSDTVIENDKTFFYLNIINQRLFTLNELFSIKHKSVDQALSNLKPPIFWKDKPYVIEQARKWNKNKIKNTLSKTFDLEIKFKSNSILDKNIAFKKLLLDICAQASL